MNTTDNNEFLAALFSKQINAEIEKENNLFGLFVGEWEFDWYGYEQDMEAQHEKGEWIFSYVLEGRAIQDIWIIPERKRRNTGGLPKGEYGTTIRFYNDELKVWQVIWVGPLKNRFTIFEARKTGNEIVMEEMNNPNQKMRWIFSDMTDNSFKWRSVISENNGKTWTLSQEMIVKRKPNN